MNKEVILIDANKLYAVCVNQAEHALENGRQEIYATMMYVAKDLLENQPTIDPESMRPHGKWEEIRNAYDELEGRIHKDCGREVKTKEN